MLAAYIVKTKEWIIGIDAFTGMIYTVKKIGVKDGCYRINKYS